MTRLQQQPAKPTAAELEATDLKETERIQAPAGGPGRGPMGGGMVGGKANTFGPSVKRLVARMSPYRVKTLARHRAHRRQRPRHRRRPARARSCHRPDLQRPDRRAACPAGHDQGAGRRGPARAGRRQDRRHGVRMDLVPGQGVDFDAVGQVLLIVLALYVGASMIAWLAGYLLNDVVQGTVRRMRDEVEEKVNALPLSYFDRQPRGELLSRVTNDIDNVSQTLQQTLSQLLTSMLTVFAVLSMMFWISPVLALVALVSVPISMVVTAPGDEALAGDVRRPVAAYRPPQRAHRGDLLRARAGQGLRPPGRGRAGVQGGERRAVEGVVQRAVRERADHADHDVRRQPQLRRDRRARWPARRQRLDVAG